MEVYKCFRCGNLIPKLAFEHLKCIHSSFCLRCQELKEEREREYIISHYSPEDQERIFEGYSKNGCWKTIREKNLTNMADSYYLIDIK